MQITPLTINDLLTGLINTGSVDNTTTNDNNVLFGAVLGEGLSNNQTDLPAEPIIGSVVITSIQNNEVSDQVKNALLAGGKISLEINNPKDILANLLSITKELNPQAQLVLNNEAMLHLNVEQILDSLKIKDVVVDNQQITDVLTKFIQQLDQLFSNIIETATQKGINNLDEFISFMTDLKDQLKIQVKAVVVTNSNEIKLHLSKIKIIMPEIETISQQEKDSQIILRDNLAGDQLILTDNIEADPLEELSEEEINAIIGKINLLEPELLNLEQQPEAILNQGPPAAVEVARDDSITLPEETTLEDLSGLTMLPQIDAIEGSIVITTLPQVDNTIEDTVVITILPQETPPIESSTETTVLPQETLPIESSTETKTVPQETPPIESSTETPVLPKENPPIESSTETTIVPQENPPIESSTETTIVPQENPPIESSTETTVLPQENTVNSLKGVVSFDETPIPITNEDPENDQAIKINSTGNIISSETQEDIAPVNILITDTPSEVIGEPVSQETSVSVPVIENTSEENPINIDLPADIETDLDIDNTPLTINLTEEPATIATEKTNDELNIPMLNTANTSTTKTIKNILSRFVNKVLDTLNLHKSPENTPEITVKIDPGLNNIPKDITLNQNLLDKIQLLQTIAPEILNEIEVNITPDRNITNKLSANLNKSLNIIKELLSQELNQVQNATLNIQNIKHIFKINLIPIVNDLKKLTDNNEVKIIVPTVTNALNEAVTEKAVKPVMLEPQKSVMPEIIVNQQAGMPRKEVSNDPLPIITEENTDEPAKPVEDTSKKSNAKIDRSISIPETLPKVQNPINNSVVFSREQIDSTIKDKETINIPKDHANRPVHRNANMDLSNKNVFNILLNNSSDPALIGLKANKSISFANNLSNIINTNNTNNTDSIVNQVIDKVRSSFAKSELTIALKPSNLGNVNVNISVHRGMLVAYIMTETARAYDSLKVGVDSLRQTLVDNGVNVDRIVVSAPDNSSSANNNSSSDSSLNTKKDNLANNNGSNNQQEKSATKEAMEFNQFKQSQQGKQIKNTVFSNNNIDNNNIIKPDNVTNSTATTEDNYIDIEKGIVNYRI